MATQHTYMRGYVNPIKGLKLQEAAKRLSITRPALVKRLLELDIFDRNKMPHWHFVRSGLFVVESRQFTHKSGKKEDYPLVLITATGLTFISNQLHALSEQTPAALRNCYLDRNNKNAPPPKLS